jgi:O-antigen/teichoic acid export membrane protein
VSLAGAASRGAAVTLVSQWIRLVVQLSGLAILARLLSQSDYGLISMVLAVVGVATILGDFGLSMASIQAKTLSPQQRSNLFWINFVLGVVLGGVVFASSWPLAAFYGHPELIQVTQLFSLMFVINATTAQFRAEVSRHLRFKWMAAADIVGQVGGLAVALYIALNGGGYWALVFQQLVAVFLVLVVLVFCSGWFPGLPSRRAPMRDLLSFGVNTTSVQVLDYASTNVHSVLLGRFSGSAALGEYDRAYQLFKLPMQQLAAPLTRVVFPVLSRIDDDDQYNRYLQRAQLVMAYVLGGAFALAVALSGPLIEIILGEGWDASKGIFAILAIGGIFHSLGYVYNWIFLSKGMTGLQLRFTVITRTVMVVLIVIGLAWGIYGVAWGSAAGMFADWLLMTIFAVPRTGVKMGALLRTTIRPMAMYTVIVALVLPLSITLDSEMGAFPLLALLCLAITVIAGLWMVCLRSARCDLVLILEVARMTRRR